MLAPVAVHADYFHQGIGSAMITKGIKKLEMQDIKGYIVYDMYFNA